jgi:membrane-associated PAP2 superfamily phosphatase
MVLYFLLPERQRMWGLALGLAAGWSLGTYQMLKGAHFLGHTVASMFFSWLVILGILQVERFFTGSPRSSLAPSG